MTPKEYFFKNFDNSINEPLDESVAELEALFPGENISEVLRTDYPFSNDYVFNEVIKGLKEHPMFSITENIYVGKLSNLMPNCYTVNSDEIEGCLICYTTGMSENVNLFAQFLLSVLAGKILGVRRDVVDMYVDFLLLELTKRIRNWYGGAIESSPEILMVTEFLQEDNIYNIIEQASNYSVVMDSVLIFHEYAHYVLHTFMKSSNSGLKGLTIRTTELYVTLCVEIKEFKTLPKNEIMADLMALLLLTYNADPGPIELMSIFVAFLQLKKMSKEDNYTNEHRLKVVHFFFKDNYNYQRFKDKFIAVEKLFSDIIDNAFLEPFDEKTFNDTLKSSVLLIYKMASMAETKKKEIFEKYAEIEKETLLKLFSEDGTDFNLNDYEEF